MRACASEPGDPPRCDGHHAEYTKHTVTGGTNLRSISLVLTIQLDKCILTQGSAQSASLRSGHVAFLVILVDMSETIRTTAKTRFVHTFFFLKGTFLRKGIRKGIRKGK